MKSIIIRGPLGIGKSTVAKAVAARIESLYISVDQILMKNKLERTSDGEGIPLANFLKANEVILEEARQAHASGQPVVIDGNFYHQEQLEQLFHALGDEAVVITLRASVETCLVRDAAREKPYGEDPTRVVHMFVSRFDYGTILDTENQTVEETIQAVMNIVRQIL